MEFISAHAPLSYVAIGVLIVIIILAVTCLRRAKNKRNEKKAREKAKADDIKLNEAIENKSIPSEYIKHSGYANKEKREVNFDFLDEAEKRNSNTVKHLIIKPRLEDANEYTLDEESKAIKIGRDDRCNICISNSSVSRFHCKIYVFGRHYYVKDLGSTAGTILLHSGNEIVVEDESEQIRNGDALRLGNVIIDLVIE